MQMDAVSEQDIEIVGLSVGFPRCSRKGLSLETQKILLLHRRIYSKPITAIIPNAKGSSCHVSKRFFRSLHITKSKTPQLSTESVSSNPLLSPT
jgi:hypothetical protein